MRIKNAEKRPSSAAHPGSGHHRHDAGPDGDTLKRPRFAVDSFPRLCYNPRG